MERSAARYYGRIFDFHEQPATRKASWMDGMDGAESERDWSDKKEKGVLRGRTG